jgi:hypothetical protein
MSFQNPSLRITWLEISYTQRHGIAGSFAGIFKMAVRFYNELNNLNTAGFYAKSTKKAGKYYEVERMIALEKEKSTVIYINFACFFKYPKSRYMYVFKKMSIASIFYANI